MNLKRELVSLVLTLGLVTAVKGQGNACCLILLRLLLCYNIIFTS